MDRSKWEYKKLGEVATFINGDRGVNYPSQTDFVEVGIPFVNAGHLTNNKIDFSSMNYIKREKFDKLGSGKIKKGDILFCLRGSLGKKAIADNLEEGAIASSLVIIRPSKLNTYFLSYYLESPSIKREIRRSNNGSSQPNLSAKSVSQFVVAVPSITDQQRIVAELDCLNEMIAVKQEQLKEFDKLAQSIFYDMFGDPDTNGKGWKKTCLNEVCCKVNNIRWQSVPNQESYNYVDLTAVNRNNHCIEDTISINKDNAPSRAKQIIKTDDVLFGTTRPTLMRVCQVKAQFDNYICSTGFCVLRPNKNVITPHWLFHLLLSNAFYTYIEPLQSGASYPAVSDSIVKSFMPSIPPLSLQQQFADKISAIEAQKELVKQSIAETQHLLNYTMDKYFG